MEPVAPVIALGKSGEQVGAGRVDVPDDRWQEAFTLMARSAHAIFLLPSERDGTYWEIDFLTCEPALLDRTVFLVPPPLFKGKIFAVERDPGTRPVASRPRVDQPEAKTRYGTYAQVTANVAEAIHDTLMAEGTEVRTAALRTLEGMLPPNEHATVRDATAGWGGALLKLRNDGGVRVSALGRLQVGDSGWSSFSTGPQFNQSLLGAGLLKLTGSERRGACNGPGTVLADR